MNIVQKNILVNLSETLFLKTTHENFYSNLNDFKEHKLSILKQFLNTESIDYIVSHINSLSPNILISNQHKPLMYDLTPTYCFELIYKDNIWNITQEAKEEHKKEKETTTKYINSLFDKIINKLRHFLGELVDCLDTKFEFDIEVFIDSKKDSIHEKTGSNELEFRILHKKQYNPGFFYDQKKKSYHIIDLKKAKARFSTALNNLNVEDNLGFCLGPWKENLIKKIIEKTQEIRDKKQVTYIKP